MTFTKGNTGFLIAFLIIGAVFGSALGTFISGIIPSLIFLKKNLTGPIGFNLEIISFYIHLNLSAIIGLAVGIFIFKKV